MVVLSNSDREDVTTDFVRAGDLFLGPTMDEAGYVSATTLIAALPSSVYQIPIAVMRDLCLKHPIVAIELLQLTLKRTAVIRGQLRRVSALDAEAIVRRVLHDLTQLAPTEIGSFDRRISQSVIASYTGLSRAMVNKTMKGMEDRGFVKKGDEGVHVDPGFASTDFGAPPPMSGLPESDVQKKGAGCECSRNT